MVKHKRATSRIDPRRMDRLVRKLPDLRQVLRGSLVQRYRRCGRPNCHCANRDDPGHGPAYYLMVTTGPGKTVQVYVPKQKKSQVEQWIKNFNIARDTLDEISTINRDLMKQGKLFEDG